MALDLSGFNVILLAQNQACSDSKQDSKEETRVTVLFGDRATLLYSVFDKICQLVLEPRRLEYGLLPISRPVATAQAVKKRSAHVL